MNDTAGKTGRKVPAWHEGPVCLIGDATHAMLPSAQQGASMALEDAIVLTKCLRDVSEAEELVEEARRNGSREAPTRAHPRIRDLVAAVLPQDGCQERPASPRLRGGRDEKVG